MRTQYLLAQRRAGGRHAGEKNRAGRAILVFFGSVEPLAVIEPGGELERPRQMLPVVRGAVGLRDFVGAPVTYESLLVILDIIEEFAHGVAQMCFVPGPQWPLRYALSFFDPGGIVAGHFPQRSQAGPRLGRFGVARIGLFV